MLCAIILFESRGANGIRTVTPMQWAGSQYGAFDCLEFSLPVVVWTVSSDPLHPIGSVSSSAFWKICRNPFEFAAESLGWPYGNLSAVVLGLVAIVAVMIAIIWGKLVVVGIIGFLSGNYWSEPLLSLVLSGVLLLLAIASWALSFRLQYRAILERDLV
jgi:hypothetical protein